MKHLSLTTFLRVLLGLVIGAFVVIALPSCSYLREYGKGVSGGVYYYSEEYGAKAGLEYRDGEGRVFGRKDIIDPTTGEPISQIEFEKRFPQVTPEK